jgi:hypothetical protein
MEEAGRVFLLPEYVLHPTCWFHPGRFSFSFTPSSASYLKQIPESSRAEGYEVHIQSQESSRTRKPEHS